MIAAFPLSQETEFVIVAICGFSGTIVAQIIGSILAQRNAAKAAVLAAAATDNQHRLLTEQAEANAKAQIGVEAARRDASKAQQQAIEAAKELVKTAQNQEHSLVNLKEVAVATHLIVNNQRTTMLQLIATMARRIVKDNPRDKRAKQFAKNSEIELQAAIANDKVMATQKMTLLEPK
jgi:hypothetical protein